MAEGSSTNLTSLHYSVGNFDLIQETPYACTYKVTAPEGHHIRVEIKYLKLSAFNWELLLLDNVVYDDLGEYITPDNDLEVIFEVAGEAEYGDLYLCLSDYVETGRFRGKQCILY